MASCKSDAQNDPQKLVLSGASGLVGRALSGFFEQKGHVVYRLIRGSSDKLTPTPLLQTREGTQNTIHWEPQRGVLDPLALEGMNTVIHLSGELIAQRWTKSTKQKIADSRLKSTQTLVNAILKCKNPPKNFFCASATGFYGDRQDEILTENSACGAGFASELCEKWENASLPLKSTGMRVVHMRFGIVLSKSGGALARMLPLFKWGLGSPLGSGKQMMSWVALEDLVRAVDHCLASETLEGPVNFVSPHTVTNREFSATLAKSLHRPLMPRVPVFLVNLVFGDMGRELLLTSQNVVPDKLLKSGFVFQFADLADTLSSQGLF